MTARETFWSWLGEQQSPRVLEIGTRAWDGKPPVHHKEELARVNPSASWLGCDKEAGDGVDVVADAHDLNPLADGSFDAVVCVSTIEHVARPWVAAEALARVVRPGGRLWVETHQCFPIHGYPSDYYRFTAEGLKEVFNPGAGWERLAADYSFPAKVVPLANGGVWNFEAEAWLNVGGVFRRLPAAAGPTACIDIDGTLAAWPAVLGPLTHALRAAGWRVVLLTGHADADPATADRAALLAGRRRQVEPFGAAFDEIVVCVGRNSSEVAARKGEYLRDHAAALFLDDSPGYVEAARQLSPTTLTLQVAT